MARKNYVEPDDYFPKAIRKEFKLGEFNDNPPDIVKKSETKETRNKENEALRKTFKGK